jgi:hypothetical protein
VKRRPNSEQRLRQNVVRGGGPDDVHKRGSTYHSHTHDDAGGRFLKQSPQYVIGSTPIPQYPTLPQSSPSNQAAAVPAEEPLGVDLSAAPIVGEPHEVAASLDEGRGRRRKKG